MIVLAVRIRCKPEKTEEAKSFFSSFVPKSHSEPGCIQYELFQATQDASTFYFFEKWASQETFDLHSAQPYLQEFHNRFGELLTQPNEVLFLKSL